MLFPTIYLHWRKYQNMLIETARNIKGGVVLAGDGRHDSMGHSAKFCAYTMFCCTLGKIIHFDLVQVSWLMIHWTHCTVWVGELQHIQLSCCFLLFYCREIRQEAVLQWNLCHLNHAWTILSRKGWPLQLSSQTDTHQLLNTWDQCCPRLLTISIFGTWRKVSDIMFRIAVDLIPI
jgi:hypothetical protein